MQTFFSKLQSHRGLNFLLIVLYGAVIIWGHDTFVKLSVVVMNSLSLPVYNLVVKIIGALILLIIAGILIHNLYKDQERLWHKVFYLLATSFLLILHFNVMLEMNIEIIHAIEYSLLCILIYPLAQSFGGALVFSIPFMLIDEFNQYVHLYPQYTKYFEFNDIILDILGAGMAMVFVYISIPIRAESKVLYKRPELYLIVSLVLIFFGLLTTCFIAQHETTSCNNTVFILSKLTNPQSFWQVHDFTKAIYHVCTPVEGFLIMILLATFFLGMDIKKAQQ